VLALAGNAIVTVLPSPEVDGCVDRPCWAEYRSHAKPVSWNPHLDVEHQPPVASGGMVGGTAVNGPLLRLSWNVERLG
jgi:hypothetical protein